MLSPDTDGDAASEGAAEGALDAEGDKKGVEASDWLNDSANDDILMKLFKVFDKRVIDFYYSVGYNFFTASLCCRGAINWLAIKI
jgi:hypothetical protein